MFYYEGYETMNQQYEERIRKAEPDFDHETMCRSELLAGKELSISVICAIGIGISKPRTAKDKALHVWKASGSIRLKVTKQDAPDLLSGGLV
jgi:hypothetical protein